MVEVTLPLRLRSPQNGSHGHWAPQAARRKRERQTAAWLCRVPLTDMRLALAAGSVRQVTLYLTRLAPRSLDGDNAVASFKSVRDGVTDALGLKDDDDPRLVWRYDQEKSRDYAARITAIDSGENDD